MVITSCGDSGDCVYLLCVAKHIAPRPHTLLIEEKSVGVASTLTLESAKRLCAFVKDLVEAQPYMKECRMIQPGDFPQWRSGGFRQAGFHENSPTLLMAHLKHHNHVTKTQLKINTHDAWLTCEPSLETKGMVVINRTSRYLNHHFHWSRIVEHYGGRIVFVGLQHEHEQFCEKFGYVSFRETKTLLEVARLIAGCELFIGNQSCANAVAEGLKKTLIQEVSLQIPDCVFPRPNAQHVADGKCTLPDVSGSGELDLPPDKFRPNYKIQTTLQPQSGWHLKGFTAPTYRQLHKLVMKELSLDPKEAHEAIVDDLYLREPSYFGTNHEELELTMVRAAISGSNDWRMAAEARRLEITK